MPKVLMILWGVFVLFSAALRAQPLPLEQLFEQPGIFGTVPRQLAWSPDGATLAFSWARGGESQRGLWLVDAAGMNLRRADKQSTDSAALRELAWLDGNSLLSLRGAQLWRSDIASGEDRSIHEAGAAAYALQVSPDGRYASYLRDGDLWLFALAEERERRLTEVGLPALSEPRTGRYSRPEREIGPGIWGGPTYQWSPDGSVIAVHFVDRRGMRSVPFPNYLAPETDPNPVRRGYPGDANEARHVGLLRITDGELDLLPLGEPESTQIVGFEWSRNNELLIDTASDTASRRRIYSVASDSLSPMPWWDSERESRIYTSFSASWAPDGESIVALSDHQNFYGLYRIPRPVAGADISELRAERLDGAAFDVLGGASFAGDAMIFAGTAGNPSERQLFRLANGEDKPEQLTEVPGYHAAHPAPDGETVAIIRSDDRSPPELYLLHEGSEALQRVTESPTPAFDQFVLAQARYLTVPGDGDRAPLHVRMLVPADFDESKSYPVLFGPMYSNTVRNRWGYAYTLMQQALTQRGYLVVQVDMRGSTGYGRAFREAFLNDFAGGDIEDVEAVAEYLKTLAYVDGAHLGIWGSSYGGTLSVYTLLKKPGLFAAGVAAAAAVDPAFFGTDDVAIVGRPEDGTGIFERRAETLVDQLEDPLLLVHGLQDQVVPFKTVASLADAFVRAGKHVETAFLPGATHGWRREPPYDRYVFQRMLEFFDRHLKGAPGGSVDDEKPLAPEVLAALTASARSESFDDDLHPGTARTGRALTTLQQQFDVRHYALDLRVIPDEFRIEGSLTMRFLALESLSDVELDLDPDLEIVGAYADGISLDVVRDGDRFRVGLAKPVPKGDSGVIEVRYRGRPHVALAPPWHGGFVWSEVDGKPWFATAVQTEGCDLWWPCKDTFADKPDEGVRVSVTAPDSISVASVGRLTGVSDAGEGWKTWHWESRHPYTGYAIAINGGPYARIDRSYAGINGVTYPVQFWALNENKEKAEALIDSDVVPDLAFFEGLLGPYPWGDEKVGFVETPHLGMEHQTINGYGEQYEHGAYGFDGLLHHELAHEWFGNLITHERPEDAWLHEGYGAYMQAVYAEQTVGQMGYFDHLYAAYTNNEHCEAVVDGRVEDVGEAFDNRDIYTKGSWLLHTLRRYVGETVFWRGTRRLLYDTPEPWSLPYPIAPRYRSTEDFIRIMSDEAGEDLRWLVEAILYEAAMPELQLERGDGVATLSWKLESDRPFPMPVTVSIDNQRQELSMDSGSATVAVATHARLIVDPDSVLLRKLPIIGSCEEQTEDQVQHNLDRFTRMARDYGWKRP